jgi:hypothetical protein
LRLSFIVIAGALALGRPLVAQDPFEIVVYPAATAERGEWELETHLNYTARGTSAFAGTVAPTRYQTRFALELTRGITSHWEASFYLLGARRPDVGAEYAGWRLRSRVRAPDTWRLPFALGFSAELEAPRPAYGGASPTLELTPILERRLGSVRLGLNANLEKDLGEGEAGGEAEGWEFEPSALVGVILSPRVTANLEYHGAWGELTDPLGPSRQVHQLFPGVDLHLGETTLGFSIGVGTANAANRLVFASRAEFGF